MGDTVSVITRRPNPARAEIGVIRERLPDGTRVFRLDGGPISLEYFLIDHERLEALFLQILDETQPDLLHVNHLIGHSPRFLTLARQRGIPIVLALYDVYFRCPLAHLRKRTGELCDGPDGGRECARTCFADEGPVARTRWRLRDAYYQKLLTLADQIVTPSEFITTSFAPFLDQPARAHVVPVGVSREGEATEAILYRGPQKRGRLSLAFIGAVVPYKGPGDIVDALAQADLGPVDLLLIGQAPDPAFTRSLRERAATIPQLTLRLYGRFEHNELAYLLDDVDCTIVPSQVRESFSIVAREALQFGLPVLAAGHGALPEAIQEGVNGFTYPPGRTDRLAELLKRLATDEPLLTRLRAGARATRVTTVPEATTAMRAIHDRAVADRRQGAATVDELGQLEAELIACGTATWPSTVS